MYKSVQHYDLSKLKPLLENESYALYGLGFVNETIRKGVRVDKKTKEQVDVVISLKPKIQVIDIIRNGKVTHIR